MELGIEATLDLRAEYSPLRSLFWDAQPGPHAHFSTHFSSQSQQVSSNRAAGHPVGKAAASRLR